MNTPVDYECVAGLYREGRKLSPDVLARWKTAIDSLIGGTHIGRVMDVGAGTGIFSVAWATWGAEYVVAVEPSAAMRRHAMAGCSEGIATLAGVGERLPIRLASIDIAWMSTVLHHLSDASACVDELARVLARDGLVLIRGLFSDRGSPGWLAQLPGASRAASAFPSAATTRQLMEQHGFIPSGATEVEERTDRSAREGAAWIRKMRHADSFLALLTDEEIRSGVERLDGCADAPLEPAQLTLLAFRG